jgi:hypothetical protein
MLKGSKLINLARLRRNSYNGVGILHRIALVASRLRNAAAAPPRTRLVTALFC